MQKKVQVENNSKYRIPSLLEFFKDKIIIFSRLYLLQISTHEVHVFLHIFVSYENTGKQCSTTVRHRALPTP